MKESRKGLHLSQYWPFWGLHFGVHVLIGILANIAGIIVVFTQGEILNGLALIGAGSFAMINGWQGFVELKNNETHPRYKKTKESSQ